MLESAIFIIHRVIFGGFIDHSYFLGLVLKITDTEMIILDWQLFTACIADFSLICTLKLN